MAIPRINRLATRDLDPAPAEVLSPAERARATAFKLAWGEQHWTREPGAGRVLLRLEATYVPLIELCERHAYTHLQFLAWRRDHEGLKP